MINKKQATNLRIAALMGNSDMDSLIRTGIAIQQEEIQPGLLDLLANAMISINRVKINNTEIISRLNKTIGE